MTHRREPGARGRRPRQAGAAAIEFALILPVFLVIVFGCIDFGLAISRQSQLNNAAREGAREGVFNPDPAAIEMVVRRSIVGVVPAEVTVCTFTISGDASGDVPGCPPFGTPASGDTVVVRLGYANQFVTPAPSMIGLGLSVDIAAEVRMRIE